MTTANPIDVIADVLASQPEGDLAAAILDGLTAAGVVVMAPQDIEWGTCDQSDEGTHRVALNMCTYCLEYDPE